MLRVIISLFIISCLSCSEVEFRTIIGADFRPYVKDFATLYEGDMPPIVVEFGSVKEGKAASCTQGFLVQKTIKVKRSTWDVICEAQRRALIFHELGHCVLGRMHTENEMSYMFKSLNQCEFYEENIEALDYELFHPNAQPTSQKFLNPNYTHDHSADEID